MTALIIVAAILLALVGSAVYSGYRLVQEYYAIQAKKAAQEKSEALAKRKDEIARQALYAEQERVRQEELKKNPPVSGNLSPYIRFSTGAFYATGPTGPWTQGGGERCPYCGGR